MYNIQCTLNGLYQDITDDSGSLWGFHDSSGIYIGNGLYYVVINWTLYPSGEESPMPMFVKFVDNHSSMTDL